MAFTSWASTTVFDDLSVAVGLSAAWGRKGALETLSVPDMLPPFLLRGAIASLRSADPGEMERSLNDSSPSWPAIAQPMQDMLHGRQSCTLGGVETGVHRRRDGA